MLTNDSELKNTEKILIDTEISNIFENEYDITKIQHIINIPEKILVYDNIFTEDEVDKFIVLLETNGFINYGNPLRSKFIARIPFLNQLLLKRILNIIPKEYDNSWSFTSINDCFRCVKCNSGSYLNTHFDMTTIKSINEQSKYTIMFYFSNNDDGSTYFDDYDLNILPKKGRIIIFDQKLKHSGKINSTLKYLLRSELYYERKEKNTNIDDVKAVEIYFSALNINSTNPTKAFQLEEIAFKMSETLEEMIYNL